MAKEAVFDEAAAASGLLRTSLRAGGTILICGLAALAVGTAVADDASYKPLPALEVQNCTVAVGLKTPFSVLHVSDSHVTRVDSRDSPELCAFALSRSRMGRGWGDYYLDAAVALARSEKATLVHTGDMIAFHGEACLEYAARLLLTDDMVACVGNHEYWLGQESRNVISNSAYCQPRLKRAFGRAAEPSVREVNGVNFFSFDNASELVTQKTADAFEEVVKRGKPIVLVCHAPLSTPEIRHHACGNPDGVCDDVTRRFVERVRKERLVKAVLAGHLHVRMSSRFSETAMEYVAGALFNGEAQMIRFE